VINILRGVTCDFAQIKPSEFTHYCTARYMTCTAGYYYCLCVSTYVCASVPGPRHSPTGLPSTSSFYPPDAMLAQALAITLSVTSRRSIENSKWMDGSSWFLAFRLLLTYPTLCCNKIHVSTQIRVYFPLKLCPKLWP